MMIVYRKIGQTLETNYGYVDLIAVRRALAGQKVQLRTQEREYVTQILGIDRKALHELGRGPRPGDRHKNRDRRRKKT